MTIKTSTLWQGGYLSLYEGEVHQWLTDSSTEKWERIDLSAIDADDPNWEAHELHDETVWLTGERAVLIDNLQAWNAASVNSMIKHIAGLETEFVIAFVQRNATKPIKAIQEALTDTDIRDRGVPSSGEGLADWMVEWLDGHDVGLPRKLALRISDYVGEETDNAVIVVQSLALGFKGLDLEWGDISPQLGKLGSVSLFDLTKKIVAGDRAGAVEVALRIAHTSHPLQVCALLLPKYRQYVTVASNPRITQEELAEAFALKNPRAAYFTIKEARALSLERAIKSFTLINEVERGMKGGSHLDGNIQVEVLASQLAQQFRLAKAS